MCKKISIVPGRNSAGEETYPIEVMLAYDVHGIRYNTGQSHIIKNPIKY